MCGALSIYGNYVAFTGVDLSDTQFKSVDDFVRQRVLRSPDIQAAGDPAKQYACEKIAAKSAMNYGDYLQSRRSGRTSARDTLKLIFEALGENYQDYTHDKNVIVKKPR